MNDILKAFTASGYAIKNQMKEQLGIDPECTVVEDQTHGKIGILLWWTEKDEEKVLRFELPSRMIDRSYVLEPIGK
jgi:hypothetical protein